MSARLEKLVRIRARQRVIAIAHRTAIEQQVLATQEHIEALHDQAQELTGTLVSTFRWESLSAELQHAHVELERQQAALVHHQRTLVAASTAHRRAELLLERARADATRAAERAEQRAIDDLPQRRSP